MSFSLLIEDQGLDLSAIVVPFGSNHKVYTVSLGCVVLSKVVPCSFPSCYNVGSIPGLERSPGVGTDNPLRYFCLENSIDRGAWQTTAHELDKELDKTVGQN